MGRRCTGVPAGRSRAGTGIVPLTVSRSGLVPLHGILAVRIATEPSIKAWIGRVEVGLVHDVAVGRFQHQLFAAVEQAHTAVFHDHYRQGFETVHDDTVDVGNTVVGNDHVSINRNDRRVGWNSNGAR